MAGAGYKLFATGDVLTAAQVNTYLNEQTVMVFADSAARTTALSGVLAEGMMSYLQDTDSVEVYDGSAWTAVGGGGSSPLTTKGDLYGFSTVDARVPIGTNGHVLTADSTESLGLKWAAPAGGGFTYTSYSPSFTNLTVGNGSWAYAVYAQSGKMVHYIGKFDLGSTSSVSGNITISLPVTAKSNMYGVYVNTIQADDNGVGDYPLLARIISPGTSFDTFAINAAGTYAHSYTGTGATVPITWSSGDQINFSIVYEAA
jgi:hypothetical protein